jgi:hypothetical protein
MDLFSILDNSKLFLGVSMLMMNIGGKYVIEEIPDVIKQFFSTKYLKALFIFFVIFIGTRDTKISIIITIIFYISFKYLFRTNSKFCILPQHIINLDLNNDGIIDSFELKKAQETIEKYSRNLIK